MGKTVRYQVSWPEPHTHQFHVVAEIPSGLSEELFLRMPTWNPGSYLIREFSRHVSAVAANVPIEKVKKDTWRVAEAGKGCRISYRVYANELTVRTCHLDDSHAFFNGVGLFLFADESRALPVELTLDVPEGWSVCTGLEQNDDGTYIASDYDELVDCPVEAGTHEVIRYAALDVPHEVVMWGRGNYDADRIASDLTAITEASAAVFDGSLPYSRYAFITHLTDSRGGGLEHHNSSVLNFPQLGFQPDDKYAGFLQLATHELFHVWNVKRIKPVAFSPYDYSQENYTKLLWVMEGITDYYAMLICARAGVSSLEYFCKTIGERLTRLAQIPGRLEQSLEESSQDTWIKLYRPDENSINSTVSYYLKGSLVALALDLAIRERSKGAKSLDHVMRALWSQAQEQRALEEAEFGALVEEATGIAVTDLLTAYVSGTDELDVSELLRSVGLVLHARPSLGAKDKGGKPAPPDATETDAWLGAVLARNSKGQLLVQSVPTGSPAAEQGLYAGDEVLALDGWRTTDSGAVDARLSERAAGDIVELTVFRRDQLQTVSVKLGKKPADTFWIEALSDAGAAHVKAFESWIGQPHPSVGT